MIKGIIASLLGGAGLSALSLAENKEEIEIISDCSPGATCTQAVEKEGFPFSFINDHADTIDAGKGFLQDQFDLAPALANLIFWAIIAAIVLKFLSWAFEKFSMLVFVGIIIVLGASYFGLIQAV